MRDNSDYRASLVSPFPAVSGRVSLMLQRRGAFHGGKAQTAIRLWLIRHFCCRVLGLVWTGNSLTSGIWQLGIRRCILAIYVKALYQIAGQTYCRHHTIKAAVAAGVITEIRAWALVPAVAMSAGVTSRRGRWCVPPRAAPTLGDTGRTGPQDPGEPVLAGPGSPGGMNHRHSCRQAGGEGGWPSRRADDAGTHIQTFIVYLESAPTRPAV